MMIRAIAGHVPDVELDHDPIAARVPAVAPPLDRDFERIYETHVDFIWRAVRALGVPERNVDDAVQDVFIVAHRQLGSFEGRSALRSWLFGIARRVAADHRRWARRKDRGEELRESELQAVSPPQLDAVASAEALAMLQAILDAIDEDKRETFVLIEIERMTAPEVAEVLGINVNTVYSRLRAARIAFNAAVAHRRACGGSHG